MRSHFKFEIGIVLTLVFLLVISFAVLQKNPDGKLHVYFLDVGQGDAIFVRTPSGNQILIDGGPDNSVIGKLGRVMPFYDRDIDLIVLTHPDADHISGLIGVQDRYEIKNFVASNIDCDKSLCQALDDKLNEFDTNIFIAQTGQILDFGDGVFMEILLPFDRQPKEIGKANNSSVVSRVSFAGNSVLLTGDIERRAEERLVFSNLDISANILKVAHHGSKTSSTENFLNKVSPSFAVMEVGENNYGHPHEEILTRLEKMGIRYYRTDSDGDVHFIFNLNGNIAINN